MNFFYLKKINYSSFVLDHLAESEALEMISKFDKDHKTQEGDYEDGWDELKGFGLKSEPIVHEIVDDVTQVED